MSQTNNQTSGNGEMLAMLGDLACETELVKECLYQMCAQTDSLADDVQFYHQTGAQTDSLAKDVQIHYGDLAAICAGVELISKRLQVVAETAGGDGDKHEGGSEFGSNSERRHDEMKKRLRGIAAKATQYDFDQ